MKTRKSKVFLTPDIENKILNLHSKNVTNKAIGLQCNVSNSIVKKVLDKYNLKPNGPIPIKIEQVSSGVFKCSKCCNVLPLNCFFINRKGTPKEYMLSYCKKCKNKQTNQNINSSIERFLAERYTKLKCSTKREQIPFNIDKEDFINQYFRQEGKCFYTGINLDWGLGNKRGRNTLSVDKIIPEKGYIKGNFVFCCFKVNEVKNDLSLEEIQEYLPLWSKKIEEKLKIDF